MKNLGRVLTFYSTSSWLEIKREWTKKGGRPEAEFILM